MFLQLEPAPPRHRRILVASIAFHGLILGWLLHAPEPLKLQPSSVALGSNGRVLARLYFRTLAPDDSDTSSSDRAKEIYRRERLGHDKLVFKPTPKVPKQFAPPMLSPSAEDDSKTATLSKVGHGAAAGRPYGSIPGGPIYGDEVRPALPITTADPLVYPWERPESEGKVVIEITIDQTGQIIRKTVLQSLGSDIDNKCLAALDNWRFQPATRNGAPIASKQDAIFPFKARG